MKHIKQEYLTGERALFKGEDLRIYDTTFADGESPLKESKNIELYGSMFKWKYPLWYAQDIKLEDCVLFEMGRAGIWYTNNISMKNCTIEAPKNFRRTKGIKLEKVTMPNAGETMWSCNQIKMNQVSAKGDYFAMNSSNIHIDGFDLVGNYSFDGVKNMEIHNARLLSKDAFWNSENVTVYDSFISGEYLGWNAKNLTFINCTIESNQGMCYIDNLVMKNCRLLNTTLAFEYSTVDVEITGRIDSVLNPSGGKIRAGEIGELIMDASRVDVSKTLIQTTALREAVSGWWEQRHNFKMEKEWLVFTTGVVPAISSGVRKLTIPDLFPVPAHGTYLLWLDCSSITGDASELGRYLRTENGLYLSEGIAYGENAKNFMRMNIACPRSRLLDGLKKLKYGINSY